MPRPTALLRTVLAIVALTSLVGCSLKERRIEEKLTEAHALFEKGKLQDAKKVFEEAYLLDTKNRPAVDGMARVGERQGRIRLAYLALDILQKLDPDDPRTRLRLALVYLRAGQLDQAQAEALFVLEQNPNSPTALLRYADASDGSPANAKLTIDTIKALEIDEAHFPVRDAAYATVFTRLEKYQPRAKAFFERALSQEPNNPEILVRYAKLLWRLEELEAADRAYAAAVENAVDLSSIALDYAFFKIRNDQPDAAIALLHKNLEQTPEHLPSLSELSKLLSDAQNYADAEPIVATILKIDPNHAAASILQGKLHRLAKRNDQAIAALEKATAAYPRSATAHYELGLAYLAANNATKGISSLQRARQLGSDPSEINILLAGASLQSDNLFGAILEIRDYLSRNPDDLKMSLFLGETHMMKGDFHVAADLYQNLEKTFPNIPDIPYRLGLAQIQLRQPRDSTESFFRAFQKSGQTYYPALQQLVGIDLSLGKTEQASARIEAFENATEPSSQSLYLKALVAYQNKQVEPAQLLLEQAIELNPQDLDPYFLSARINIEQDQNPAAIDRLRAILEIDPESHRAAITLGDLYSQSGNIPAAIEAYRNALRIDPTSAPAANNLAYFLSQQPDRLDDAYELANRARSLHPNDPIIADTLGWIVYLKNNYSWATPILEEAATRLSNQAEPTYHYAKALYAMGDAKNAASAFRKAVTLSSDFDGYDDALSRLSLIQAAKHPEEPDNQTLLATHLDSEPTDPIALVALARSALANDDTEQALVFTDRALAQNPENGYAQILRAQTLQKKGQLPAAFAQAKSAYELIPDAPEVTRQLGILAYLNGQHKWSHVLLNRTAQNFPLDDEFQSWLIRVSLALGNLQETEKLCHQISLTLPDYSPARETLAFLQAPTADSITQAQNTSPDSPAYLAAQLHLAQHSLSQNTPDSLQSAIQTYTQILATYPNCSIAKSTLPKAQTQLKSLQNESSSQAPNN